MATLIDPAEVIRKYSVEQLSQTAEEYFRQISDHTHLLSKPFSSFLETPELLARLGALLAGLKLGRTMIVLDFGAGSCWLSRLLNQMQCVTISVDTSRIALEIGQRLFRDFPIVGDYVAPPQFLWFNGHRFDLEDDSVDRIICCDAFHHIPNQEEVLGEFFRVLKPGGIAGFAEPGPYHSRSPDAQMEMRNYKVLENDIRLGEIIDLAERVGFSDVSLKLMSNLSLDLRYADYLEIVEQQEISAKIRSHLISSMLGVTVFFLAKRHLLPDSRGLTGLKHSMRLRGPERYAVNVDEPLRLHLTVANIGSALWLHTSVEDVGTVKVGMHLYDKVGALLEYDFFRSNFESSIKPGESIEKEVTVQFSKAGEYILAIDLVSEHVCWFETLGSERQEIHVVVQEG